MCLIVTLFVVRSHLIRAQVLLFAQYKLNFAVRSPASVKRFYFETVLSFGHFDKTEVVLTKKMAIITI